MKTIVATLAVVAILFGAGHRAYAKGTNNHKVDVIVALEENSQNFSQINLLFTKYNEVAMKMAEQSCHPLHPISFTISATEAKITAEFFCKK